MTSFYTPPLMNGGEPVATYWHELARRAAGESGGHDGPLVADAAPLEGDVRCDVAIIGGGYTGLGAALQLARFHGADVRVLEAGPLGWGASGRNAGFCGPLPFDLSIEALLKRYGAKIMRATVQAMREAIGDLREIPERESFDAGSSGNGLIEVAHEPAAFARLKKKTDIFRNVLGVRADMFGPDEFAEGGFASEEQFGAALYEPGLALDPLKLLYGLARAAAKHGARIHPESRVIRWRRKSRSGHLLQTRRGTVRAKRVIVAANGYLEDGLNKAFERRMCPVLSNILVTRPISETELQDHAWAATAPCITTEENGPFFRLLPDRSFLFGARGGIKGTPEEAHRMREWLTWRMGEMFPAWKTFEVLHFWRGPIATTRTGTPAIGRLRDDRSVYYAFGFHGNGVAMAPWAGRFLARAMVGDPGAELHTLPPPLRGPAPRYPGWIDPRRDIIRRGYQRRIV